MHLLSAYAAKARRVLASQAVAEKSHEITALPDLLARLDVRGAVVTIEAMGCQKTLAQAWVAAGADDVLALKANHPVLPEEVRVGKE